MLYTLLKIYVRFAARFYFHDIQVSPPELLTTKGPLLIASNHPNTFLDGIIYDIMFDIPIWSLARGDTFTNTRVKKFFRLLKLLPIYRRHDGQQNILGNYQTFNECLSIFSKKEAVLIFSEGFCINEWHLRPLKKGTARLAFMAWEKGIPLQVLPAGINHSSFCKTGAIIHIHFGNIITHNAFNSYNTEGDKYQAFTDTLYSELHQLVYEIPKEDTQKPGKIFPISTNKILRILLFIPAVLALMVNSPIKYFIKWLMPKITRETDFHGSLLFMLTIILYPVYLITIAIMASALGNIYYGIALLCLLPLCSFAKTKIFPAIG